MTTKLLPCPFCGGTNIVVTGQQAPERWVLCDDCNASTQYRTTEDQAIEDWNRRAPGHPESRESRAVPAMGIPNCGGPLCSERDHHPLCSNGIETRAEIEARALEDAAKVCDELEENWSAYKDTALLNGDVGLSIAASGEPRAARFIAGHLRQLAAEKRAGNNEMENVR